MASIDIFTRHATDLINTSSRRILKSGRNWTEEQLGDGNIARAATKVLSQWASGTEVGDVLDKMLGINIGGGQRPFKISGTLPVVSIVDDLANIPTMRLTAQTHKPKPTNAGNTSTQQSPTDIFKHLTFQLPMPQSLANSRTFDWSGEGTASIGTEIYKAFANKDLSMDGLTAAYNDFDSKGVSARAGEMFKSSATKNFLGENAGNYRDYSRKAVVNDDKKMLFKGSQFRQFQFDFDLVPKDERQTLQMMALIRGLEYHSSPDLAQGGLLITYPTLWDITFHDKDGLPMDIQLNLKPCAVTSLNFNYTPDGLWKSYNDGNPLHLKITIGFQETELLYKSTLNRWSKESKNQLSQRLLGKI